MGTKLQRLAEIKTWVRTAGETAGRFVRAINEGRIDVDVARDASGALEEGAVNLTASELEAAISDDETFEHARERLARLCAQYESVLGTYNLDAQESVGDA